MYRESHNVCSATAGTQGPQAHSVLANIIWKTNIVLTATEQTELHHNRSESARVNNDVNYHSSAQHCLLVLFIGVLDVGKFWCINSNWRSSLGIASTSARQFDTRVQHNSEIVRCLVLLAFLWVPELSPCLSYQILRATAHNDWTLAVIWLQLSYSWN
jgi:hypothetical protein